MTTLAAMELGPGTHNEVHGDATGLVIQASSIHQVVVAAARESGAPHERRGLPRRATLIGRDLELEQGRRTLLSSATRPVLLVHGPPGAGKSAFAINLAWSVADHFPGGVVYLDRSHHEDLVPVLLTALAPGCQMPGSRQEQLAKLAELLSGPRVLLLLDDVLAESALEDVIAIDSESAVLCTSRSRLTGLAGDDVMFAEIGPLRPDDAAELAGSLAKRLSDEERTRLAAVCGCLPIAVRIASARVQRNPMLSVEDYLAELADPDNGLGELRAGEKSVERIVEDSYRLLSPDQAELLATMGLLPRTTVTVDVVTAALADPLDGLTQADVRATRRMLGDLYELNLVEQVAHDAFRLHDILYRFARSKAPTDRAWRDRVIANSTLAYSARIECAVHSIGFVDEEASTPSQDNDKALAALHQDCAGVVATIEAGVAQHLWDEAKGLISLIIPVLQHLGRWVEFTTVAARMREVGERTNDAKWHASGLLNQGTAAARAGRSEEAIDLFRRCCETAVPAEELVIAETARSAYGELLLSLGHAVEAAQVIRRSLNLWRMIGDDRMLAEALSSVGKSHLVQGQWNKAESYFRNALRVARRGKITGRVSAFGVLLAEVLRLTGRADAAEAECLLALERARAVGDRGTEADALRELGMIQDRLGDPRSRFDTLTAALGVYEEVGDVRSQVSTLLLLGNAAEQLGERVEAMNCYRRCVDLAMKVDDVAHVANGMAEMANLYGEAGKHDTAEELLRQASEIAEQSGGDLLRLQVQHQFVQMLRRTGRVDETVPKLRENVKLLEKGGDSEALATARTWLGEALLHGEQWLEAASTLRLVTEGPVETVSTSTRASAFRFLATLYSRRELWSEALQAGASGVALAGDSGSKAELMHCHHTMGNVFARMEDWDGASVHYECAAELADRLQDFHSAITIRNNQAARLLRTGDRTRAITVLTDALGKAEFLGNLALVAALRNNLGSCQAEEGDLDAAVHHFELSRAAAEEIGNRDYLAQALKGLGSAAASKGDHAIGVAHTHKARLLWQEIRDWNAAAEALELELRYRREVAGDDLAAAQFPHDVDTMTSVALRARYAAEAPTASTAQPAEHATDQRTIFVAHEVRTELVDVEFEAICARLATGRRSCVACGLQLADSGPAHLVLLKSSDERPDAVTLAHPACAPSTVARLSETANLDEVRFEIECILWHGTMPGVVVDARGPWGLSDGGEPVDLFLESLRRIGFGDIGPRSAESVTGLRALPVDTVRAQLVGDRLKIRVGSDELAALPLSFYPHWYRAAARARVLLMMFGHDLRGMVADDPRYVLRAADEGNLVGAAVRLDVVPPSRTRPCVCTPRTRLKYKHCCGKAEIPGKRP
jgi:tetratricopeptide (TPR) repeat protein